MTSPTPDLAELRRLLDDMRALATREGIYNGNRAVLDIIGSVEPVLDAAARMPVWQPVEPGTIRPGMRVRYVATGGIEGIFTVEDVADGRFYFKSGYAWSGMSDHAWFVDPRTVPAEPVDPRAELLAEELHKLVADFQANGNSRSLGDPTAGAWFEAAQRVLDALDNQAGR